MEFTKFTLGAIPECQKVFFYRTSFCCSQGGPKHCHAVLGHDRAKNTTLGFKTEAEHTSMECLHYLKTVVITVDYCGCHRDPPGFHAQAIKRIAQFIFQANKVNTLSWQLRHVIGRKNDTLLLHENSGIAILSPHGREGWGLDDLHGLSFTNTKRQRRINYQLILQGSTW